MILASLLLAATLSKSPTFGSSNYGIVDPAAIRQIIERFNAEDRSDFVPSIPNAEAWPFLSKNIPLFECPDPQFEETYYYRWWSFRKHLKKSPAGWVITEFLPNVPWAGTENTISCAAGHHLYEARWLRDPVYAKDDARFWMLPEAQPRQYSFWAADAVRGVGLAGGDLRFQQEMLPNLVANYRAWERTHGTPGGLFQQVDDRDGMEYSLGGSGFRPTINSYMFGDASAIAAIASECGESDLAQEFQAKAAALKAQVQAKLWNPADKFFETVDPASGKPCGVREEVGFVPWYFHLPDPEFATAWQELNDPAGFKAAFGPTTAERRAAGFMHPENHDCLWNGPSWPYATTQTLVALANLLNGPQQSIMSSTDYFDLLLGYARSQQKDGRPWIAEDLDPDTGKWIVDLPRSVSYNHSGFADLVITGLVGLRPRSDDRLVVHPLLPRGKWSWFCLEGVPYHGHSVSVVWDEDGRKYGLGAGLTLLVDGRVEAHRSQLGELEATLTRRSTQPLPASALWRKYPSGPVLGGALGTCFDVCLLKDDNAYAMYFSWRPQKSIAVVKSADGIHWSAPTVLIGPRDTGWEEDINRPSVVKLNGVYHMWYTGQFKGQSAIGYATSRDGLHWERQARPVLQADQPWEKVAVMCPSVLWDAKKREFRMWYSGGEQYEPDAIGYASSPDGVHWTKHEGPIFEADPTKRWEQYKVTACQVLPFQGWYYMFYIGFRDIDHAQIGIARSRDGLTGWQRMKDNPILSPTVNGWDADACYKPFAIYEPSQKRWMLWYNGRHGGSEQIGLATKTGPDLGRF